MLEGLLDRFGGSPEAQTSACHARQEEAEREDLDAGHDGRLSEPARSLVVLFVCHCEEGAPPASGRSPVVGRDIAGAEAVIMCIGSRGVSLQAVDEEEQSRERVRELKDSESSDQPAEASESGDGAADDVGKNPVSGHHDRPDDSSPLRVDAGTFEEVVDNVSVDHFHTDICVKACLEALASFQVPWRTILQAATSPTTSERTSQKVRAQYGLRPWKELGCAVFQVR